MTSTKSMTTHPRPQNSGRREPTNSTPESLPYKSACAVRITCEDEGMQTSCGSSANCTLHALSVPECGFPARDVVPKSKMCTAGFSFCMTKLLPRNYKQASPRHFTQTWENRSTTSPKNSPQKTANAT